MDFDVKNISDLDLDKYVYTWIGTAILAYSNYYSEKYYNEKKINIDEFYFEQKRIFDCIKEVIGKDVDPSYKTYVSKQCCGDKKGQIYDYLSAPIKKSSTDSAKKRRLAYFKEFGGNEIPHFDEKAKLRVVFNFKNKDLTIQNLIDFVKDKYTPLLKNYKANDIFEVNVEENKKNKDINEFDKNIILFGPPGTGKTYNTVNYAVAICENKEIEKVNDEPYDKVLERFNDLQNITTKENKYKRIAFITFHQSYGYEEFIEGIKPILNKPQKNNDAINAEKAENNKSFKENKELQYEIVDGVFKEFCNNAKQDKDNNYVFIIDEINRGNISKIFGELITLIEDSKRDVMEVDLPYSKMPFSVPKNVYIIGTMNTADRSIALMDTALRRRFSFIEMMPKPELLKDVSIKEGNYKVNIETMLTNINKRIEFLYDREHTLGHAFFIGLKDKKNQNIGYLAKIFKNKVIPLLQEYFYDDYEKIRYILGDNAKPTDFQFITCSDDSYYKDFLVSDDVLRQLDITDKKVYKIESEAFDKIESYFGFGITKSLESSEKTSSSNSADTSEKSDKSESM